MSILQRINYKHICSKYKPPVQQLVTLTTATATTTTPSNKPGYYMYRRQRTFSATMYLACAQSLFMCIHTYINIYAPYSTTCIAYSNRLVVIPILGYAECWEDFRFCGLKRILVGFWLCSFGSLWQADIISTII